MQSRFNVSLSFYAETCTKYLWYFRRCAFLITFFYFLSSNHRAAVSLFTTFHSTHSVLAELLSPFYYPEISVSLFLSFLIPRSEFFFFFFFVAQTFPPPFVLSRKFLSFFCFLSPSPYWNLSSFWCPCIATSDCRNPLCHCPCIPLFITAAPFSMSLRRSSLIKFFYRWNIGGFHVHWFHILLQDYINMPRQ